MNLRSVEGVNVGRITAAFDGAAQVVSGNGRAAASKNKYHQDDCNSPGFIFLSVLCLVVVRFPKGPSIKALATLTSLGGTMLHNTTYRGKP